MKEDSRSEQILSKALARQQQTLDEFDSKRFLSCFGIPVTDQSFTQDAVAAEAERMGLPVVLKACGTSLTHKTEAGGVSLDMGSAREVREEGARLLQIKCCQGLLVQEMVQGDRELLYRTRILKIETYLIGQKGKIKIF